MPPSSASSSRPRSWALVAALILASVWTGDTRPGDDFLTAAVIPSAAHAAQGTSITVAGINFNPGGVFGAGAGGFGDYDDDDDDYAGVGGSGGGGGAACVFGGGEGVVTSSVAEVRGGSSLACVVPRGIAAGFVSVGISGNRGVDAKFFHYDEVMVNFAAVGEVSAAVGPNLWARGDPVFIAGKAMIPLEANAAVVGQSIPCGWWAEQSADPLPSSSGGAGPGAFVSSALRQCEAPAVADFARVVAVTEHQSPPPSGPFVAVAEPPRVVSVRPGATAAEGGGILTITTTGGGGRAGVTSSADEGHRRASLLARVGTTRVALRTALATGDSGRCVAPARSPTSAGRGGQTLGGSSARAHVHGGGDAASVALMATHFGAGDSEGTDATGIRFVPAPRAGLMGGPAAGAADAAVPSPAGALFRLFFSPLPPRSVTLWCVVGSGGGRARQGHRGVPDRTRSAALCRVYVFTAARADFYAPSRSPASVSTVSPSCSTVLLSFRFPLLPTPPR